MNVVSQSHDIPDHCYAGLDLGGTSIKAGLVTEDGVILDQTEIPTGADEGSEHVIENLFQAFVDLTKDQDLPVRAVGIGSPGMIDSKKGEVISAPNLKGFVNLPLAPALAEKTGLPTFLENDANAAALGEFWVGAAKGDAIQSAVMLTLGTGVGSGIVLDGDIFPGAQGSGAELGHMIVSAGGRRDKCGQIGCLEAYGSATALKIMALERLDQGLESNLDRENLSAKDVVDGARESDPAALAAFEEFSEHLGIAIVNCCRIFDPQVVIIAGGVSKAGDFLLNHLTDSYHKQAGNWPDRVQIRLAQLGNDAGFIGAAGVALKASKRPVLAASES